MIFKGACLSFALAVSASFGAAAAPLDGGTVLTVPASQVEKVRHYRYWGRRYYPSGPFWTRDFWGRLRYVGPYSKRAPTHQY